MQSTEVLDTTPSFNHFGPGFFLMCLLGGCLDNIGFFFNVFLGNLDVIGFFLLLFFLADYWDHWYLLAVILLGRFLTPLVFYCCYPSRQILDTIWFLHVILFAHEPSPALSSLTREC